MKVTEEMVAANMQEVLCRTVVEFDKPTTYVTVRMKNGFTVRESTTCVDPKNYNEEVGKRICLERIKDKIYLLLGYSLQNEIVAPHASKRLRQQMDAMVLRGAMNVLEVKLSDNSPLQDNPVSFTLRLGDESQQCVEFTGLTAKEAEILKGLMGGRIHVGRTPSIYPNKNNISDTLSQIGLTERSRDIEKEMRDMINYRMLALHPLVSRLGSIR